MRPSILLVPTLALLATSSGCTRPGAVAGAVFAYELAEGMQSTDNPEQEWTTADVPSDEEEAEGSSSGMVRPVPPHMPASAADQRVERQRVGFDLGGAYGVLAHVNLDPCKAQGLTPGYGRVIVAFEPAGAPVGVGVALPAGSAPSAHACVEQAFRAVHVAPFEGAPVNVRRAFYVKG
jgi:hypothetical protein